MTRYRRPRTDPGVAMVAFGLWLVGMTGGSILLGYHAATSRDAGRSAAETFLDTLFFTGLTLIGLSLVTLGLVGLSRMLLWFVESRSSSAE